MGKPNRLQGTNARELYDKGLNDHEIARKLGVHQTAIFYWRKRNKLKPNTNRGAQHGQKNAVFKAIRNGNWKDPMKMPDVAEKVARKRLGENNPNWKGGLSKRSKYGRQRLRRMGLISSCWLCGSSRFISVHHIDGKPKDNDISNLLVLCTKCHAKFHNWGANGFKKGNTLWKKRKGGENKWSSKVN